MGSRSSAAGGGANAFATSLLSLVLASACSAGGGGSGGSFGPVGGGGSAGTGATGAVGGGGAAGGGATDPGGTAGGGFIELGGSTSVGGSGGTQEGCGITQKPEEIIEYSPVGLFIMVDRSGSMVTGFPPPASADGWNNATTAISAFVQDPSSNGLSVGLGAFPPMAGSVDCAAGTDCGTPIVPMAELPANSGAMTSGMQSATPNNPIAFTPIECGLRGILNECPRFTAATGIQCVGVLVTDGTPTQCDGNMANLEGIVAGGAAQGVKTFVISMPGSNLQALNGLAQAGGTGAAIDVSGGPTAFIDALNAIRGQVSVGTKLPCEWTIPPPPNGQAFDPAKVNISFTPKDGTPRDFGYVAVEDCVRATDAWYFDDPANPTRVLACPTTCDMLTASSGAEVDVSFGCARKPATIQ